MIRLAPSGPVLPFLGQMSFRAGTASGATSASPPVIANPEGGTSWRTVNVPPKGMCITAMRWQGRANNALPLTGVLQSRLMYAEDGVNFTPIRTFNFDPTTSTNLRGLYVKDNFYLAPGSKFYFEQQMLSGALTSTFFIINQIFFFEGSAPQ